MLNALNQCSMVSVVMPVYNAEKYLQEAIESILKQTYENFEFIIINDGSEDHTNQIIGKYSDPRIIYLKNETNMGVAQSLNRGLGIARGKYIMRLDSDDIAFLHRIETQVNYLENHEEVYVMGSGMRAFGDGIDEYDMIPSCFPEQLKIDSLFFCPISHPSVMFRKSLVDEGFLYDPEFERIEDYELWVRIMRKHIVGAIPDILVKYRIHGNQVTQSHINEINSAVVKLHKRQMKDVAASFGNTEFDGYSYIQKSMTIEQIEKKIDIFNKMLCDSGFTAYYDKDLCREHFYMTIRNELFRLNYAKKEKGRKLYYVGKKWNIGIDRVLLDELRMLRY